MEHEERGTEPGVREWTCGCTTSTADGFVHRDCAGLEGRNPGRSGSCVRRMLLAPRHLVEAT